jgi:hypothetical protein
MIQFETSADNAKVTLSVIVNTESELVQDLLNQAENKVRLLQKQYEAFQAQANTRIKKIRAIANTFNQLSHEEKQKAEITITKLCLQYENIMTKAWQAGFMWGYMEERITKIKSERKIYISNLY